MFARLMRNLCVPIGLAEMDVRKCLQICLGGKLKEVVAASVAVSPQQCGGHHGSIGSPPRRRRTASTAKQKRLTLIGSTALGGFVGRRDGASFLSSVRTAMYLRAYSTLQGDAMTLEDLSLAVTQPIVTDRSPIRDRVNERISPRLSQTHLDILGIPRIT